MSTTMISVKIEKELKENASKIAKDLGFSLSAIINASLKKLVREKKVEFDLEPEYNPEFVKEVLEAEKDYKNKDYVVLNSKKDRKNFFANLAN